MNIKTFRNLYFWIFVSFSVLYFLVLILFGVRVGLKSLVNTDELDGVISDSADYSMLREVVFTQDLKTLDVEGLWYIKIVDDSSDSLKIYGDLVDLKDKEIELRVVDSSLSRIYLSNAKKNQPYFKSMILEIPRSLFENLELKFSGLCVLNLPENLEVQAIVLKSEGSLKLQGSKNMIGSLFVRSEGVLMFDLLDGEISNIDIVAEGYVTGEMYVEGSSGIIQIDGLSKLKTRGSASSLEIITSGVTIKGIK